MRLTIVVLFFNYPEIFCRTQGTLIFLKRRNADCWRRFLRLEINLRNLESGYLAEFGSPVEAIIFLETSCSGCVYNVD